MKDTIVMCPTLRRATIEWDNFCYVHRSIIQSANRKQLKIVLLGGATLFFKGETEGQRAVRGFHADICSIDDLDDFIEKVGKDGQMDNFKNKMLDCGNNDA